MEKQYSVSLANLPPTRLLPRLLLIVTHGNPHQSLTELIVRLALRGSFHLIAGSDWLPDQDSLRRAVRRHTVAVEEALDRPILGRPATCLQLRDQLEQADLLDCPIFILDFLHYFYDPDVDLSLRQRVLEQCVEALWHLSQSKSVLVLVQYLPTEEYEQFFPGIASVAHEILEAEEESVPRASQLSLFGEG